MVKVARPRKRSPARGIRRKTSSGSPTLSTLGVAKVRKAHTSPTATPFIPEDCL